MKKERLYYLDFVRAVSMFIIVIYHFNCSIQAHGVYMTGKTFLFSDFTNGNAGLLGVSLFFILSGASLMYTYSDKLNIKTYLKKRWIGIFPMFYLAWIIGTLFMFYKYRATIPHEKWTIILTILGMDGYLARIFPNYYLLGEWFLGCIIILYIIFPILLWISKKIGTTKLLIITFILYLIMVQCYDISIFSIDTFFLSRVPELVFGMFVVDKVKKIKWWYVIPCIFLIFFWSIWHWNINVMYMITVSGIAFFVTLMYIGQMLGKRLSNIFRWLSKYSYPVFLVHHVIVEQICMHFEGCNYSVSKICMVFAIYIVATFGAAAILEYLNKKVISTVRDTVDTFKA